MFVSLVLRYMRFLPLLYHEGSDSHSIDIQIQLFNGYILNTPKRQAVNEVHYIVISEGFQIRTTFTF